MTCYQWTVWKLPCSLLFVAANLVAVKETLDTVGILE